MYRKPAPNYAPSPASTPGPQQSSTSRPLPTSPRPPAQSYYAPQHAGQHQKPYLGPQSQRPMSDEEAFELGYPDRATRSPPVAPPPAHDGGLQALYGATGYGVNVTQSAQGGGQYGVLPQSGFDEPNPFQDPSYGATGYDSAPMRPVSQHPSSQLAPDPSHTPANAFSPPPSAYQPTSPYQLPAHRALSPIGSNVSAFDATLAAFGGNPTPSPSPYASVVSPAPPVAPQQQPYLYHPSQAVDPEQYAGYDRYTPKNLYGENQPARLRSRSPTPPLEEDLGDGGRSPSLEEHFQNTDPAQFVHLLPPTNFEQDEKAAFLEEYANGQQDGGEVAPTQHFGPAPEGRVLRRNKTRRKVKLTESGNLVVQAPIPSGLAALLAQFKGDPERTRTT